MAIVVKVGKVAEAGKVGAPVCEYALPDGATVQNALEAASMSLKDSKGKEFSKDHLRVNGEPAELATKLADGSVLILTPTVKGA